MDDPLNIHFNIDGEPISFWDWAVLFERSEYRMVASTRLGSNPEVRVSTIWLGLDQSLGHGRPVLFETMVFGLEGDEHQTRYHTKEEALAGHQAIVTLVEAILSAGSKPLDG